MNIIKEAFKGLIIAVLYFELTHANDTTAQNVTLFAAFYVIMVVGGYLLNMDLNIITNAFVTKVIFTMVDERIKKKEEAPVPAPSDSKNDSVTIGDVATPITQEIVPAQDNER